MKFKFFNLIGALLLIISFVSCTHRIADFTIVSSKNFPIFEDSKEFTTANTRVKGVDKAHMILFIPTGTPDLKEAIDRAIEKYPKALGLSDAVVKYTSWTAIVYGQMGYIVEGTPIILKQGETFNFENTRTESSTGSILFYHEVKSGDTVNSVAAQYGISIGELIKWNKLSSNTLLEGSKLLIYLKN